MENDNTRNKVAVAGSKQPTQCQRKPTQKQQILNHLKDGKSITQAEAVRLYNCWRLPVVISRLRKEDGYNIKALDEPNVTNNGIHARYVLISEPINPTAA